ITLLCIFTARLLAIFFHIEIPIFDYSESIKRRKK
ncbi:TPA: trimeric intracellular cation channel family protein, partial [Legionella pneumophila]